jgi:hypothetical protein
MPKGTKAKVRKDVLAAFDLTRLSDGGRTRLDEIIDLTLGRYFSKAANRGRWRGGLKKFVLSCAGKISSELARDRRRAGGPRVRSVAVRWMRRYSAVSAACGPALRAKPGTAKLQGPLCDPYLDSL